MFVAGAYKLSKLCLIEVGFVLMPQQVTSAGPPKSCLTAATVTAARASEPGEARAKCT